MKLAWTTDIHLDCVNNVNEALVNLARSALDCDGIIISGDISTGKLIVDHLNSLEDVLQKPIYFVLGNHDYYYSDILDVRRRVAMTCRQLSFCKYLGAIPFVKLSPTTALVGSDGWYDAYNGNLGQSEFIMNDWLTIADFQQAVRNNLMGKQINTRIVAQIAREICKASVAHIVRGINSVAQSVENIVVVTHVPPFEESYTNGKYQNLPNEHVTPWYTSKMMGEMLKIAAKTYPHIQFTILSGHTHSPFEGDILSNLHVKVGKSQYGSPQIVGYIDT
jgi:predicted phosphohydrolase